MVTSGIRLGTPAGTTREFGISEFEKVGNYVADILDGLVNCVDDNQIIENTVREQVLALCSEFPIYPD